MPADVEISPAVAMLDAAVGDAEGEGKLAARTEGEGFERKAIDEGLRRSMARKPGGPYLNGQTGGVGAATLAAWIEQQIAKPPCATAVGETATQEPHFVATLHAV